MLKKIIVLFFFIIFIIIFSTYYYKTEVREEKIYNIMDQLRLTLNTQLELQKMEDLRIALLLSKNKQLIDTLENDDEDAGYLVISDIVSTIQKYTKTHIRAQVITNELNIFARSWDDVYAGMPIGDYRTDLDYFNAHKTPRTSIEVGRRLGVKATVPIYRNKVFLGYVEAISFFKTLTDFFSSLGVDFYVLLNVKNTDTAVLMMQNLSIDKYILANRNYNYAHIQMLKSLDFKELVLNGVIYKDNNYIFYENMHNGNGKVIGGFLFVLPERYLSYFRNTEDKISFLINLTRKDLYDVVREEEYENKDVSTFGYIQSSEHKQRSNEFLDEEYGKLDKYSKDELIQILLNRKVIKKIDGKIK